MSRYNAKSIVLKNCVDEGLPGPEHFYIEDSEVNEVKLLDGGILVQAMVFSADPYLRNTIKTSGDNKGGDVLKGFIAGKVLASKSHAWKKGDLFGAYLPFSTIQIVTQSELAGTNSWKLTGLIEESQISYGIGVMGMPGSTAYGGLIDVLRPNEGETIFISAASGAVGSLVGQLAKHLYKCKVVGSVGGPVKSALIKEKYGFEAIDYKTVSTAPELIALLKGVAPEGIDMYFENVGGIHFEAAMNQLRAKGRVAVCGNISEYNTSADVKCNFNPMNMIYKAQRIEGFTCYPWLDGTKGHFLTDMSGWLKEGVVRVDETFYEGIEQWPNAFQALFTGANVGKVVVRVA